MRLLLPLLILIGCPHPATVSHPAPDPASARATFGRDIAAQFTSLLAGPLVDRVRPIQEGAEDSEVLVLPVGVRPVERRGTGWQTVTSGCLAEIADDVYLQVLGAGRTYRHGDVPVRLVGSRTSTLTPAMLELGMQESMDVAAVSTVPTSLEIVVAADREGHVDLWLSGVALERGADQRFRAVQGGFFVELAAFDPGPWTTDELCTIPRNEVVVTRCAADPAEARARAWAEGLRAALQRVEAFDMDSSEALGNEYDQALVVSWRGVVDPERASCTSVEEHSDGPQGTPWCATATCTWSTP